MIVNVLTMGNCCYFAVCSAAQGASAPTGERGGGIYRGGCPPTACLSNKQSCMIMQNIYVPVFNRLARDILDGSVRVRCIIIPDHRKDCAILICMFLYNISSKFWTDLEFFLITG